MKVVQGGEGGVDLFECVDVELEELLFLLVSSGLLFDLEEGTLKEREMQTEEKRMRRGGGEIQLGDGGGGDGHVGGEVRQASRPG